MGGRLKVLCFSVIFCLLASALHAEQLPIAQFSTSGLEGWKDKVFSDTTSYRLIDLEGKRVLAADSRNSASGLMKKVRVDIREYPYLNWSWRIENRMDIENEKIKQGDDYAARIYVVIDGGILIWRTRAVNYVWASAASKGETWENAFAGKNALMMALRSRQDKTSTWYSEKRNVYEDLRRLFGQDFHFIDAIALMTDTDNSHGQARAFYGDIFFSKN